MLRYELSSRTITLFLLIAGTVHKTSALSLSPLGSDVDFEDAPETRIKARSAGDAARNKINSPAPRAAYKEASSATSRVANKINSPAPHKQASSATSRVAHALAASAARAKFLLNHLQPMQRHTYSPTSSAAQAPAASAASAASLLNQRKLTQLEANGPASAAKAMAILRQVEQLRDGLQDMSKTDALLPLKAEATVNAESSHKAEAAHSAKLSGFGYGSNDLGSNGALIQTPNRTGINTVLMQTLDVASSSLGRLASPWLWHSLIFIFIAFVFCLGYVSQSVVSKFLAHRSAAHSASGEDSSRMGSSLQNFLGYVSQSVVSKFGASRSAAHSAKGQESSCMGPSKLGWRQSNIRTFFLSKRYKIDVSEIHICKLFASGDVFISLKASSGEEQRTKVMKSTDGSFLRFNEIFTFDVRTSDGPFTLTVNDLGNRLAYHQMPAKELINLANREYREYFRCDLTADHAFPASARVMKPYVAMRIRKSALS